LAFGLRRPKGSTRGRDVAGVIEAVGDNVRRFSVGDEVYAEVDAGSFAEYTVAQAKRLAHKPSRISFGEAAAVPIAATTALQGVRDVAKIKPGDKVLINGASGGVGSFAVQLAKACGAEVTGVCSTANLEFVRSLGADHVIDYTGENFATGEARYDVIFDLVGNRSLAECRRALTRRGTLVLASGNGGRVLGPIRRMLAAMLLGMFVTQNLRPLAALASGADLECFGNSSRPAPSRRQSTAATRSLRRLRRSATSLRSMPGERSPSPSPARPTPRSSTSEHHRHNSEPSRARGPRHP